MNFISLIRMMLLVYVTIKNNMPYTIKKEKGARPWKIIKKTTGEIVGSSKTLKNAKASIRARYASEKK